MKISLITPTYNESKNIEKLILNIFKDCHNLDVELIIVDDNSPDGTAQIAENLSKEYPLKVIKREGKFGLSSAVLDGFNAADGNIFGVIDADLSHPTSRISELLQPILDNEADLVIGSRLIKDGSVEEWPFYRKLISIGATTLARPLTKIKDSMSGFFFFKKEIIDNVKLNPIGYKILLEILVKGNYKTVKEIPYIFLNRNVGESKLNLGEYLNYILHLKRLYTYKFIKRD
ncbi:hypothetical protein CL621_04210 [archaeon]|nr:hypothetical protein [archaeon]